MPASPHPQTQVLSTTQTPRSGPKGVARVLGSQTPQTPRVAQIPDIDI